MEGMSNYQSIGKTVQSEMDETNPSGNEPFYGAQNDGMRPELRIILAGKTGSGKSATGNTILGERKFDSKLGAKAVTVTCKKGQRSWNGKELVVIDTPAIFDPKACDTITYREIIHCITLSAPGPHALVLVTQLGRYTEEDKEAVKRVREIFGVGVMRHTIVLFTRKEDLAVGSLHDYVKYSDNKDLKVLIQACGNRYCAFNNKATRDEEPEQVSELMEMIQRMVQENGGRHYNSEMYLEPHLTEEKVRYYIGINKRISVKALFRKYKKVILGFGCGIFVVLIVVIPLLVYLPHY